MRPLPRLICLGFFAPALWATLASASLVGTSVTGSLQFASYPTNYFDPANGSVPTTGFENTSGTTVTISDSAVEFGYGTSAVNLDFADFTDGTLTITDETGVVGADFNITLTFTDTAFAGQTITAVSNSFPNMFDASLSGDTIVLTEALFPITAGNSDVALFTITPVPEPASFTCMTFAGAGLLTRWRRRVR